MCGSARAMGTGATRLQPGALHPEQRGVPQGSQCCTPVQAGCGVVPTALQMVGLFHLAAHPLLLAGEKILGILGVGGGGGKGWNYSFLFPPPCFSVLQTSTHRFFTVGDMLTRQHQFLTSLQYSELGQVQPMYRLFTICQNLKTFPKSCCSTTAHSCEHVPRGQGHTASHDAMRMLSAYQ